MLILLKHCTQQRIMFWCVLCPVLDVFTISLFCFDHWVSVVDSPWVEVKIWLIFQMCHFVLNRHQKHSNSNFEPVCAGSCWSNWCFYMIQLFWHTCILHLHGYLNSLLWTCDQSIKRLLAFISCWACYRHTIPIESIY